MKSKKTSQTTSKSKTKKPTKYYLVISKDNKHNFGAFPPSKYGFQRAKEWALKMSVETGMECCVKKC